MSFEFLLNCLRIAWIVFELIGVCLICFTWLRRIHQVHHHQVTLLFHLCSYFLIELGQTTNCVFWQLLATLAVTIEIPLTEAQWKITWLLSHSNACERLNWMTGRTGKVTRITIFAQMLKRDHFCMAEAFVCKSVTSWQFDILRYDSASCSFACESSER